MKLWETVSAFRDFGSVLQDVFGSERWRASYGASYARFDELVRAQDRSLLDAELPIELTREIAARCPHLQFRLTEDGWLRRHLSNARFRDGGEALSAIEVHDRFGGSLIEEVLERGSTRIQKEPNQSLQRNASTGSASNFESPARRG